MQIDNDLLYRGNENQHSPAFNPCICPSFFLSILRLMKFCVEDFSTTGQARIVIFGMQVGDDLMYRRIENQPSPAYSSLHFSNSILSILKIMKFCVKDYSTARQARMVIFGMQIDDDLLYREIENHSSPAYFAIFLRVFFFYL